MQAARYLQATMLCGPLSLTTCGFLRSRDLFAHLASRQKKQKVTSRVLTLVIFNILPLFGALIANAACGRFSNSLNTTLHAPIYNQGWSLDLYTGPGTCIGTGTVPANMDMSSSALVGRVVLSTGCDSGTGMITPHSQLRQVSLKPPVDLSLDMRPLDGKSDPSSGRQ